MKAALKKYAEQMNYTNLLAALTCECIDDLPADVRDAAILELDCVSQECYEMATGTRAAGWVRLMNAAEKFADRLID